MVFVIFIQSLIEHVLANSEDPDKTSDLGLLYLTRSHKKDTGLTWVIYCCYVTII